MAALVVAVAALAACSNGSPPDAFGSSSASTDRSTAGSEPDIGGGGASASTHAVSTVDSSATTNAPSGSDPTATVTTAPTTSAASAPVSVSSTAPGAVESVPAPDPVLALVQAYTGGIPGTAAGGTLAIGWVNQEGGTPSFSDATTGLAGAVDYLNRSLGGVGGRVIELHTCAIQRVADGARCAQQLRDDPAVAVVIVGTVTLGNRDLLEGLEGVKPVVLANPLTTADYLATDAVAFTPGSPGIISGLARFAAQGLPGGAPAKVAVLYAFGLAGEAAYQLLAKPVFDRFGIPVVPVAVIEGSDPATYSAVITEAGAADASVFLPILGARGCIGLDQALQDLGSTATVTVTDACLGATMTTRLVSTGRTGALPEGWYIGGTGYRFGMAGNSTQDVYLQIVGEYQRVNSLPALDVTSYSAPSFAALLTVAKLANAIGPDAVTADSMRAALRAFTGPMWNVVGPMRCGFNVFYPSLCGTQMGVERYEAGQFVPAADGFNGASVDLIPLTAT